MHQPAALRLVFATALVVASGAALAQGAPPAPAPGMPALNPSADPMQKAMADRMRIMKAQQTALQDPEISKEREALRGVIEKEMLKNDKTLKAKMDRFKVLEGELQAMQKQGALDREKAGPLIQEIQGLGQTLSAAEGKALANPAVKAKADAFQAKVEAKIASIDPEVPGLIKKLEEEQARMMGGPGH